MTDSNHLGEAVSAKPRRAPRESTIRRRVSQLRALLAAYQAAVGPEKAIGLGEVILPLAADIEDLQQGIDLGEGNGATAGSAGPAAASPDDGMEQGS